MTWVRRAADQHQCALPEISEGARGDMWRCDDCGRTWRISKACNICDSGHRHHNGQCQVGSRWRHATLMQRFLFGP